jgi:RimJ/RimL family protein N-acetyltransferase
MDILDTPRLTIRPFTEEDLEVAHQVIFLDIKWFRRRNALEDCLQWLQDQAALRRWRATGGYYGDRAIILKQTGALIGMCGFRSWLCTRAERGLYDETRINQESSGSALELGIGYAIATAYRRQGYATEAIKALINYGLDYPWGVGIIEKENKE